MNAGVKFIPTTVPLLRSTRARVTNYFLWEELFVDLVGGRLYALAHGVRQKVAHLGVAAGAAVWGVWMWWKAHFCVILADSGAARRLRLLSARSFAL